MNRICAYTNDENEIYTRNNEKLKQKAKKQTELQEEKIEQAK